MPTMARWGETLIRCRAPSGAPIWRDHVAQYAVSNSPTRTALLSLRVRDSGAPTIHPLNARASPTSRFVTLGRHSTRSGSSRAYSSVPELDCSVAVTQRRGAGGLYTWEASPTPSVRRGATAVEFVSRLHPLVGHRPLRATHRPHHSARRVSGGRIDRSKSGVDRAQMIGRAYRFCRFAPTGPPGAGPFGSRHLREQPGSCVSGFIASASSSPSSARPTASSGAPN